MTDNIFSNLAPGPLSNDQLKKLISKGFIKRNSNKPIKIDYSSFDLHIKEKGYELEGCLKPFKGSYEACVLREKPEIPSENGHFLLKRNKIYIFELEENFNFPRDAYIQEIIWGVATGKSSVGRVDVLVRLIVDGMREYDLYQAKKARGALFLEIIPINFNVTVKPGIALSQLRLFWGEPKISLINPQEAKFRKLLKHPEFSVDRDITALTVNLEPSTSKTSGKKAIALKAKKDIDEPIPLWLENNDNDMALSPDKYWEPIAPESNYIFGDDNSIKLKKDSFYILRSRELICLPPNVAVYCKAMDEALGEMRIHYAGFVHPYFGYERGDGSEGTNLIFEVRGHNMDIFLTHGETLAKLAFYRMSGAAEEDEDRDDTYGEQELKLSKFFKEW